MIDQEQVQTRLKRFRYQIMELEISLNKFKDLSETRFHDLMHDISTHIYDARCTLQKLQREVDESADKQWFEE